MRKHTWAWIGAVLLGLCLGLLAGVAAHAESSSCSTNGPDAMLDFTKGKEIPPEVIAKLDKNQLFELMQMKMEKSVDIPFIVPLTTGIVFACPVAIVFFVLYYRHRRFRQLHQTLAAMIEKNVPIPPDLVSPEKRRASSDLRRGIILLAAGLGVIGFLLCEKEPSWGVGLIPALIGVGYLIVWKLDQRTQVR